MSRLLALYPRAWRARYGDEFAELLEARPPTLRDRLDILIGAVDARINPQVPGADSRERTVGGDRAARILAVVVGVMFTIWGVVGAMFMVPWESGLEPAGPPELMTLAWASGMLGGLLAPVVFGIIVLRYDRALGGAGVTGAILTPVGLLMAAFGMGLLALVILATGAILFSWRANGRILSTPVALAFAAGTLLAVAGFFVFVAGGGQDVIDLLPMVGLGPSWILFGLGLRAPRSMPDATASTTSHSLAGA
jgi:MFS family permease